jgi:hypothetical protein
MDNKFRAILNSLPKKRQRSKFAPCTELIDQLGLRGRTYRETARLLAQKGDLTWHLALSFVSRLLVQKKNENVQNIEIAGRRAARYRQAWM